MKENTNNILQSIENKPNQTKNKNYLGDHGYADSIVKKKILNVKSTHSDEALVKYLIEKKYTKLYFTPDNIDENLLKVLLKNHYNSPYIYNTSEFKLTTIELVYLPKQKTIDTYYIKYMIEQYKKGDNIPCVAYGTFDKETLSFFYKSINNPKSNEISGKLNFEKSIMKVSEGFDVSKKNIAFVIKKTEHTNGESVEAEQVDSKYNFHTHPVSAYTHYNCELGWPSRDDYVIVIESFIKKSHPTIFHWICTKEGIYVLSIPEDSVKVYQNMVGKGFTKRLEDYIEKYLEIDKLNFKKSTGVSKSGFGLIKDQYSYIDYIHEVQKNHPFKINHKGKNYSFQLIEIQFFDWHGTVGLLSGVDILFKYYYPKVNGNCIVVDETCVGDCN